MHDLDLFQRALGLEEPWEVVDVQFDVARRRLDLRIDFPKGARFPCPECAAAGCKVHDTERHTWRHLNFFRLSSPFGGDFAVAATRNPCYQGTSRPQLRHHELHTPRAGSVPLSAQLARTAATGRPRSTSTARVSAPSATAKPSKRRGSEGR